MRHVLDLSMYLVNLFIVEVKSNFFGSKCREHNTIKYKNIGIIRGI